MSFRKALLFTVGVTALVAFMPGLSFSQESQRMCRQECAGSVCQEKCVERRETEGRRDRRDVIIEERRREPGVELRVPVPPIPVPDVDVRIGR